MNEGSAIVVTPTRKPRNGVQKAPLIPANLLAELWTGGRVNRRALDAIASLLPTELDKTEFTDDILNMVEELYELGEPLDPGRATAAVTKNFRARSGPIPG
jgi:hypothetical protein